MNAHCCNYNMRGRETETHSLDLQPQGNSFQLLLERADILWQRYKQHSKESISDYADQKQVDLSTMQHIHRKTVYFNFQHENSGKEKHKKVLILEVIQCIIETLFQTYAYHFSP